MAYLSNTTAFCVLFLALYIVFSQVKAYRTCDSHEDCPTPQYCCEREFEYSICKYNCIGQPCTADSHCASGECCDVDEICKESGNCQLDLPGWIVAVIIIVALVVTAAFFFCCCCAPSIYRRRAHNGVIIRLQTTSGNAVRANQQHEQYIIQQGGNTVRANQQQQYLIQEGGNTVRANPQQQYAIQQGRPMHFHPNRSPPRPYPPQGRVKKQNANDPLIAQEQTSQGRN